MSKSCYGLAILLDWSSQHSLLVLLIGKIIWWVDYFVISDLSLFRVSFSSLWVGLEICELILMDVKNVDASLHTLYGLGCYEIFAWFLVATPNLNPPPFFFSSFQYLCTLQILFFIILHEYLFWISCARFFKIPSGPKIYILLDPIRLALNHALLLAL